MYLFVFRNMTFYYNMHVYTKDVRIPNTNDINDINGSF